MVDEKQQYKTLFEAFEYYINDPERLKKRTFNTEEGQVTMRYSLDPITKYCVISHVLDDVKPHEVFYLLDINIKEKKKGIGMLFIKTLIEYIQDKKMNIKKIIVESILYNSRGFWIKISDTVAGFKIEKLDKSGNEHWFAVWNRSDSIPKFVHSKKTKIDIC